MQKKLAKDFIGRFLYKVFDESIPDGIYTHCDADLAYYATEGVLRLVPIRGEFEGHNWYYEEGCSKICFIFNDFDEVIKIGFTGEIMVGSEVTVDDDFENLDWYEYSDECEDIEPNGVYVVPYSTNYVYEEILIYNEVVSDETKPFLLENRFVDRVGDIEIYIQDKVKMFEYEDMRQLEKTQKLTIDQKNKITKFISDVQENTIMISSNFLKLLYLLFNGNVPETILEEIQKLDDLHEANVGYYYNQEKQLVPVILDYAGFED